MIDRSESHLIAREQRNRGDASTTDGARAVRARRARAGIAHESGRATRVEPTVRAEIHDPAYPLIESSPPAAFVAIGGCVTIITPFAGVDDVLLGA